MRITRIQASNWIGLRDVDISPAAPITLVAGGNGAGKTSLVQGIRAALTGQLSRVAFKTQCKALVTDGETSGTVVLQTDKGAASFSVPDGKHACGIELPKPELLELVLGAQQFANLHATERRRLLSAMSGVALSTQEVQRRLGEKNVPVLQITAITPFFSKDGMDKASTEAARRAGEAKGQWKQATGGESWGKDKGAAWKHPPVEFDGDALDRCYDGIESAEKMLAAANTECGRLLGVRQEHLGRAQRLAVTRDRAKGYAAAGEKVSGLKKAVADRLGMVQRLRATVEEEQPPGQQQQLVPSGVASAVPVHECPKCHATLMIAKGKLVLHEPKKEPPAEKPKAPDPGVARLRAMQREELTAAEIALATAEAELKIAAQELDACNAAAESLKALEELSSPFPDEQVMKEAGDQKRRLEDSLKGLREECALLEAAEQKSIGAEKATVEAGEIHKSIVFWLRCAEALGPTGIPADYLSEILGPINRLLADFAEASGWPVVKIEDDMEVSADGRRRSLLSLSEQWRADAALAVAIAKLSGIKLVVLDGMDVLQPSDRLPVFDLLDRAVEIGAIDTAVVAATLAAPPQDLGDTVQVCWLQDGRVADGN